jgi:hypothetical protein
VHCAKQERGVFLVERDRHEGLAALEQLVQLKHLSLHTLELNARFAEFLLHQVCRTYDCSEVVLGRLAVEKLKFNQKFSIQIALESFHFCSELNHIPYHYYFISVPNEKGLGNKFSSLIHDLGLLESVEIALHLVAGRHIFRDMVIGICIVDLGIVFVEYLDSNKVEPLLEQVDVPKALDV